MKDMLTPREAATLAGVSYPTLKQWIYSGKLRSTQTPGGHHRIRRSEIERLTSGGPRGRARQSKPLGLDAISGRNKLFGKVTELTFEGLLVQITIDIGGQNVTSIITSAAARALGLRTGGPVYALIKATEVMVIRA